MLRWDDIVMTTMRLTVESTISVAEWLGSSEVKKGHSAGWESVAARSDHCDVGVNLAEIVPPNWNHDHAFSVTFELGVRQK